jgi:hypothetical protein
LGNTSNPARRNAPVVKCRNDVGGVFPNPAALLRLAGAVLVAATTNGSSDHLTRR